MIAIRGRSAQDLTPLLRWFFDTRVGAKVEPDSYRRIAATVGIAAERILFLSDAINELSAARAGGIQVRLVVRPGNAAAPPDHDYVEIRSLEEVDDDA